LVVAVPALGQPLPEPANPGGSLGFASAGPAGGSVVDVKAQFTAPAPGKPSRLFITGAIQPGWHIYSITQQPGGPVATRIEVSAAPGMRIVGDFQPTPPPETTTDPKAFGDLPLEKHTGTVIWTAPIELAPDVDPAKLKIDGKLVVQACNANSCVPPQGMPFSASLGHGIALPTDAALPAAEAVAPLDLQAVLIHLAFAFLGGLILNLMPCVLPVNSLKVLAFMQQAGESRGRVFALNVWYSLGLLAVFMVLAALAATAGLAWGEQFTLAWFKVAMTGFVFVMALSFLGVWEIPIPGFVGTGSANQLQAAEGPSGAFFKGIFTTILATPCSGPFLGPVFGYLLKQPPYMAYWVFAAVGLGMASPYLVIGAFPGLIRFLPKPGAWMDTFKQLMGFLLLATVVYLFNTLTPAYFVPTLTLLVGMWFACWWIGRTPLTASPTVRATAWCGGLAVAGLVGLFAFTVLLWEPIIAWQPFSPEALERARADGKTVMVDFTANWCPNCKTNSKLAIETEAVRDLVRANGVVPMLADWTDQSPVIKKTLNELGYNSIPLLAIWPAHPTEKKVIKLPDVLTKSQVVAALKEAGPSERR
jgi:thiol:disulfide interchange protein